MDMTAQTLDEIKKTVNPDGTIAKSITTANGLVGIDLQAPAKVLYPVNTPLRNAIPRVPAVGTATNWKAITGIIGSGYNAMGWVAEGQRTARMSTTVVDRVAAIRTLGEEDQITFEAVNAGRGFSDVKADGVLRNLQKMMMKEENAILGGNSSMNLGTTPTPTLSAATQSGATIGAATYSVIAVALTYEGYLGSSVVAGVPTSATITGADGNTYVLKAGSANKSASATQAVTSGQALTAIVAPVRGAMGYAWYVGTAGSERLEAITTTNVAVFSAPLLGTGQPATAIIADNSANGSLAFDGLLYSALATNSGAYVKALVDANGKAAPLSGSGFGGVAEIDDMLATMWSNYQVSPSVIYVSPQELRNATKKMMTASGGGSLNLVNDANGRGIVANSVLTGYFNPYSADGGVVTPIKLHPTLPAGTIVGWADNLPVQYQNNDVPRIAEMRVRQDYYQIDWPLRTRQYEYGVYVEETLAVYFPPAMCVITNIANG